MRRFGWEWLAVSSVMIAVLGARAETRPQYGGILRVAMRAAPGSLDPVDLNAENGQADSFARRSVTMLMFDRLVTIDDSGRPQPELAATWQVLPASGQFRVRQGVQFSDGTPLTAEIAAASLREANPSWKVSTYADSVTIDGDSSGLDFLAELALPRNAIVKRTDGKPVGTGPFHAADWQPGKRLVLAAEENCWRGRPFLDGVEIEMGKSFRDQMSALELGKADLVEVAPEQTHRISQVGRRLAISSPVELSALLFARDAATADEKLLREALARSVDRESIRSVLLQGGGQPAASILPNWLSGYGFVFPTEADLARARQARAQVGNVPAWALGYDGSDPMERLLAERIALNAKDAGLMLRPAPSTTAELRLVRIPLDSTGPWIALAGVATAAGMPLGKKQGSVEDLYSSEISLLGARRVIPLFHLPVSYASVASLKGWTVAPDGSLTLAEARLQVNNQ